MNPLPVRRGGRDAPRIAGRIQAKPNQPIFTFLGESQAACDPCSRDLAARELLDANAHAGLQRPRKPDSTTIGIDQHGMTAFGKSIPRIKAGHAQRYLGSKPGSVPPLDQVGHIFRSFLQIVPFPLDGLAG